MTRKALWWLKFGLGLLLGTALALGGIYALISLEAAPHHYQHLDEVPPRKVGLVLGTSKFVAGGGINLYYRARIETAAKLYHAGKVCTLLVSGDNRRHNYNEPEQMRQDLIALGVPKERIVADYAGLRTLDSVLRAEAVFGTRDYLIISQKFHNQRALWLAHAHGQTPIAFAAPDPQWRRFRLKTELREVLARPKALFDFLTQKTARHYGKPVPLPDC